MDEKDGRGAGQATTLFSGSANTRTDTLANYASHQI